MRYFYIVIILLAGCQTNIKNSESESASEDSADVNTDTASLESATNYETSTEIKDTEVKGVNPDRILVDRVHYFPSTNEAYVWVGLKDDYDWRAYDTLKTYADSVIFEDDETTRTRYPFDKAREYLDLELLDGITIFNYSHELQGTSRLKRIEYYEDVLADQFIAIIETPKKLSGNKFYGISGTTDFIPSLSNRNTDNEDLKESIKELVNHKSRYDWRFGSVDIQPYDLTYTFYSFLTESEIEKSYLFEIDRNGLKKMAETTNDYSIWELSPVKIEINSRPVLLLWVGYPETDSEWFTPAVFDGTVFQITNDRIIDLSKY